MLDDAPVDQDLNRNLDLADGLGTTGKDIAAFNVVVRDAAIMHHVNVARSLADLAGPAHTERAAGRDHDARTARHSQNRIGFVALCRDL